MRVLGSALTLARSLLGILTQTAAQERAHPKIFFPNFYRPARNAQRRHVRGRFATAANRKR